METPFLCGGEYTALEALRFLWAVSVDFKPDAEARVAFNVKALEVITSLDQLYEEIDEYIEATFLDAPHGSGGKSVPYICSIAWMIYAMAREPFGWDEQRTLTTPIRRIYQYLKCDKYAKGEILYNAISDPLKEQWLANLRAQQPKN